mgnify:CR=1 FL=1
MELDGAARACVDLGVDRDDQVQRLAVADVAGDAQVDLVIFDFDGTLADSAAWMMRAVNPMARRYGFKTVSDDEIETLARATTILERIAAS